ncbi:spiro-SPASM protein, partial [Leptospira sp. 96542]|nr:spiro-SPASM protein [Leptospira sp. 96542]
KLETSIKRELIESNFILHTEVSSERQFLLKIGELLPPSIFQDPDWDEVCFLYFTGIAPVLDTELTKKVWDRHKNFYSQYSYSENLPQGLIPNILTREFLSSLPDVLATDVHSFFLKNINQYDVDIFYQKPDLRQYRIDLRLNSVRSETLIRSIYNLEKPLEYANLLDHIKQNTEVFRSAPSYLEWEIYKGCELKCSFCPREFTDNSNDGNGVPLDTVKHFVESLNSELISPITITLGGNGEPLLHKEFSEIAKQILNINLLQELIIETALFKNINELEKLIDSLDETKKQKLTVIINLTTLKSDVYKALYGADHLTSVLKNVESLFQKISQNLHVQMIKIKDVESEIDPYFTFFEKKGINVILQKYNRFAEKLPERRVSDLTPIHREFCWHLTRDLYVNVNGDVAVCKQDQSNIIGNLYQDKLNTIWKLGQQNFIHSLNGSHEKVSAPCLNCDEWYTFNS